MKLVDAESMDAIYSSHNIEHVFPHEVPLVMAEFHQALKSDGYIVITYPDLQSISKAVAQDKLLDPLYNSPAGPIAPIDILYGHRASIQLSNHFLAHKCGFTYSTLGNTFMAAGFRKLLVDRGLKAVIYG